jgi:hypothetical protein
MHEFSRLEVEIFIVRIYLVFDKITERKSSRPLSTVVNQLHLAVNKRLYA